MDNNLEEIMRSPMKRRAFLTRMGSAGLGVAAAAVLGGPLLAGCSGGSSGSGGGGGIPGFGGDPFSALGIPGSNINLKVLNFALTLERLEADLYRQALGRAAGFADYLTRPLAADPNSYTLAIPAGGVDPNDGFLFLKQFTYAEAAHRDFLITVLGGEAVAAKTYRFKGTNNDPGASLSAILNNILPLEETGVRAYLGAVPYITDYNVVGPAAGGIFSTEARHSAVINDALGKAVGPTPGQVPGDKAVDTNIPGGVAVLPNSFERYLEPAQVIQAATQAYIVA